MLLRNDHRALSETVERAIALALIGDRNGHILGAPDRRSIAASVDRGQVLGCSVGYFVGDCGVLRAVSGRMPRIDLLEGSLLSLGLAPPLLLLRLLWIIASCADTETGMR